MPCAETSRHYILMLRTWIGIEIVVVGLPSEFKVPKEVFKRRRDPRPHLMQYNDYMNILGAQDSMKYKAFSMTLKGSTKGWYFSFPQAPIKTLTQLGQLFLRRFYTHKIIMSTPIDLMLVKHKEAESLQQSIKCFHVATLNTKKLRMWQLIFQ